MSIKRIDPSERWSDAVIHNGIIYYTSVPSELDGDAYEQTRSALIEIDTMLSRAHSDKTRILDVTIFLANKIDFAEMNRAWDEWVSPQGAPVRCTVEAALMHDQYRVEIKIIAAQKK